MSDFKTESLSFSTPLEETITFGLMLKVFPTKGNLVYEYNPFRNFRLEEDAYEYKGKYYTLDELSEKFGVRPSGDKLSWTGLPDDETPVLFEAGCLVDFDTEQLQFDLNHIVEMLPQYSYDGSVNLIINDDHNIPRLINSRFTSLGKNTYEVVDRKGDNDVNIYDQGKQFDIDTSLYKRVVEIPEVNLLGVYTGGNLPVGNYVFYFKYMDDDGNETDFVAESGVVSLFIGTGMSGVQGGLQDMNTYKMVRFLVTNIDPGYSYVTVYYTRATSTVSGERVVTAHKINDRFEVSKNLNCQINITGFVDSIDLTIEDINIQYFIASSVKTQASAQNRLFLGNVHKPDIPYKELSDLSLRIVATVNQEPYQLPDYEYSDDDRNTYFNAKFLYEKTGYANGGEMYSFAVVYILDDNSLSPAFPIRGGMNISGSDVGQYTEIAIYRENMGNKQRVYISYDEKSGEIISSIDAGYTVTSSDRVENVWGITSFNVDASDATTIYSVNFLIHLNLHEDFFGILSSLNIKGFFFVRKSRIPITLCQAITIGSDKLSYTPVLPVDSGYLESFITSDELKQSGDTCFISERFLTDERKIDPDFIGRLKVLNRNSVQNNCAVCPDFDVYPGYFNQVFNGSEFYVNEANFMPSGHHFLQDPTNPRHLYIDVEKNTSYDKDTVSGYNVVTVGDSAPIVAVKNTSWRGMAGEAEEAFRFEYLERENKVNDASNLVRGCFGNYIGLNGMNLECSIINIKSSEAFGASIYDKMKTRHSDKSPYYAISKRYALKNFYRTNNDGKSPELNEYKINMGYMSNIYRGDSYICMFTHRFNRNFQDPDAPNNDDIVDADTWINGYNYSDGQFENINRGDINAVPLGIYLTFPVVSYRNLNIRSLDPSYPQEEALTGHKRGFYPHYGLSVDGSYKIPEAYCYNSGLSKNVGDRWNFPVPDVPYIKNQFQTRILYSDVHINDAFKNGFRVFQAMAYRDYPRTYGEITRLIELYGNLVCIYEHGVVLIPVNERVVSGDGAGGDVFINTNNILPENPKVLSDTFGTQWQESIIKTPFGIYGVDTVGKKIWRTDGNKFELISDFKIQEFLNDNISLTERELTPIIGIRNVKSHYNAFKYDVMFTFYDNTVGFEEKVWNICYNEMINQWMTFYSWVPSYSASIDNIYFSFDRNTSKWISKLGITKADNSFSNGIVLTENRFKRGQKKIGKFTITGINVPDVKTGVSTDYVYTLQRDNFGYYKLFEIRHEGDGYWLYLQDGVNYDDLLANIFYIDANNGRRVFVDRNDPAYKDTIVYQLNVRCEITLNYTGEDNNIKMYTNKWNDNKQIDMGYYEYSIAVIPEDNMKYLTTDFWKHGQAGIIDIADKIYPTQWYGKLHPVEVEFIVVDDSSHHKVFENLQIIGNMAEPDSFHFEVVGDFYTFGKDKENMYFRQEATKALYQYNGSDILYDHTFTDIIPFQRHEDGYNERSTLFPLYYARQDTFNEIEDYYRGVTAPNKNYVNLAGSEIIKYKNLQEYHIWTHIKATAINKTSRLRGNMWYVEDKWFVQIPALYIVQKNEADWRLGDKEYIGTDGQTHRVELPPLSVGNSPIPNDMLNTNITEDDFPEELKRLGYGVRDIDISEWTTNYINNANMRDGARIRDKYCRVRIRYTGEKLVIIQAIKTIFFESNL